MTSGKSPRVATSHERESRPKTSGKSRQKTSGKLVANPEVGTSGKSDHDDLPLTDDTDLDIELEEEVSRVAKGWRLEQNSNNYWRWRWQLKDNDGQPITYVNPSGNIGYKRGSEYVPINELEKAKKEAGL